MKALKKSRTKSELIDAVLELIPNVKPATVPKHMLNEKISVTPPKVLGERNCTPPMQKLLQSSQKILAASHVSQSAARDVLSQLENSPTIQRMKFTAQSTKAEEKKKQQEQLRALKKKKKKNVKRTLVSTMTSVRKKKEEDPTMKSVQLKKEKIVDILSEIVQEEKKVFVENKKTEQVENKKTEQVENKKTKEVENKKTEEKVVEKILEKIVDDIVKSDEIVGKIKEEEVEIEPIKEEKKMTEEIETDWVFIEEEPKKGVCSRIFSSWMPESMMNAYNQLVMRIERMRV